MSAQTGIEVPHGPASQRIGDRVRFRVDLWRTEPNPIWVREMRQAARLLRTPIILMVLTVLMTMLMASLGGILTGSKKSPAEAGSILFHVYFSLAFFVVTLVGPALAANSIASEREGQTWEAVLLTGMRPAEIARGKFLAAYTAISMYVVMLAPVGAIPFLFGGVTPFEVLIAFVFLFLIALLGVAFGLAISSKMASLRGALLVTLLVAIPLSMFLFSSGGVGMSMVVHELWPAVEAGAPVWLPTAYGRAPFGIEYLIYLVLFPVAAITVPAWLLYEITRANLTSVTDDRSHGVKRWFAVAAAMLVASAAVPVFAMSLSDSAGAAIAGMGLLCLFIMFCAFLFASEPIGPSRRVEQMLAGAGPLRRALAPGVMKAAQLQLLVAGAAITTICVLGLARLLLSASPPISIERDQLLVFAAYALGFSAFVIGLTAWLRSRAPSAMVPRVLLLVVLFFSSTGPWIVAAISGAFSSGRSPELALAAPSPFYVFVALEAIASPDPGIAVMASLGASAGYLLIGLLLLSLGGARCKAIIDRHRKVLAEADTRLADEDRAAEEARREAQAQADAQAKTALETPAARGEAAADDAGDDDGRDALEIGTTKDQEAAPRSPKDAAEPDP